MATPVHFMARRTRGWLLGFGLLGLGASATSSFVHFRLLRDPGYLSFCDVSSTVNCTTVYASEFGSIGGVSVALLGTLWFAFVCMMLVAEPRAPRALREHVTLYLFALSTCGMAAVLYLAYASLFVLETVCLMCVIVYAAVLGIFFTSGSASSHSMATLPSRVSGDVRSLVRSPSGLAVSLLFVIGSALALGMFPREADTATAAAATSEAALLTDTDRAEFDGWYAAQPRVQVPVGDGSTPVLIVKFNDYQCPPCRQTYLSYKGILERYQQEYPEAIAYVTKDYPLDPECNVNTPSGQHLAGCEAAVAVRLAREQGVAAEMEEWLFAHQPELTPETVREALSDIAGVQTFDAEYDRILDQVKTDIALGKLLEVGATPTFFINGVKVQGGLQPEYFAAALDFELKRAVP